jgi:tRNA (guanosine-2'-O-)-methyltransferase
LSERSDSDLYAQIPEELHEKAHAILPRRIWRCLDLLDQRIDGLVVAAESVCRRHNVSAILRSAEAFGLHEAHLITNDFVPSAGAAKGAERWLDLTIHDTTEQWAQHMRARGHKIYVADLSEDAFTPETVPVEAPLAVLFGGELAGVSEVAKELADGVICVPMVGVTQSLNVSVAAAVVLNRLAQRRQQVPGCIGIQGDRRAEFIRDFIERESARKPAQQGRRSR